MTTEFSSGIPGAHWPQDASASQYAFVLFGRFQARRRHADWVQLDARKMQEIVSYLLLYRRRPHERRVLAGTLWEGSSGQRARKNLRQGLWQLQESRDVAAPTIESAAPLLLADKEWVQINLDAIWLDVAQFQAVFDEVCATAGEAMTGRQAEAVVDAMELYTGDLLEGWQQEWCIFERERLKAVYLTMHEKLLGHCEASGRLEEGLVFGERLLRHDRAHERAHWRMMRLSYLAGDRTGAIRQFARCRIALQDELGVEPGRQTTDLYQQICADSGISEVSGA